MSSISSSGLASQVWQNWRDVRDEDRARESEDRHRHSSSAMASSPEGPQRQTLRRAAVAVGESTNLAIAMPSELGASSCFVEVRQAGRQLCLM